MVDFAKVVKIAKMADAAEAARAARAAKTADEAEKVASQVTQTAQIKFMDFPEESSIKEVMQHPAYHASYKGQIVDVVRMSPDEYLREANKYTESDHYTSQKLDSIRQGVKDHKEFGMPYLSYDEAGQISGQEGRHRAVVAKELGMDTIPVAVRRKVSPDFDLERKLKKGEISGEEVVRLQRMKLAATQEEEVQ